MMKAEQVYQHGFSLVELTVVLFIISIVAVSLLGPVATQIESRERQRTIALMEEIKEALYGFALQHGRLPCPDITGNGAADPNGSGDCTGMGSGWLPWQTLGLNIQADAWGNRFKYHVMAPDYTTVDNGICANDGDLDLCETANSAVLTRGDDVNTAGNRESKFEFNAATDVPAVVISHGKNGLGATTINGVTLTAPDATTDEAENEDADTDNIFYARGFSVGGDGCTDDANEANVLCQFDDIVIWLSPSILVTKMVNAEKLP